MKNVNSLAKFSKNNQLLLIIISIVFGIIATMLVHIYIKSKIISISGGDFIPVLTMAKDMREESIITEDAIYIKEMPDLFTHDKMIHAQYKDFVIGQKAGVNLYEGQIVLWNDIEIDEEKTISQMLKTNERAVTIFVDDATGLIGLLNPGDRVDIVGYFDVPGEDFKSIDSVAKVILQNITVLAVGTNTSTSPESYIAHLSREQGYYAGQENEKTVTLRLNVKDVPLFIFAEKKGEILLSLRSYEDVIIEPVPDAGYENIDRNKSSAKKMIGVKKGDYPSIYEDGKLKENTYWPNDNFVTQTAPTASQIQESIYEMVEEADEGEDED